MLLLKIKIPNKVKLNLLKEYQKLLKNEIITPEEFKKLKNELIFSNK